MNATRHLTKEQIAGYAARSLDREEKQEVGRHLLQCEHCRNLMPAPTVEQFWSAIMGDSESDELLTVEKHSSSEKSPLPLIFSPFRLSRTLAWSGGVLIIIAAFSLFIWFGASSWSNSDLEITQKVESPNTVESHKTENNLPDNEQLPVVVSNVNSKNENPTIESTANSQLHSSQKQSGKKPIIAENSQKTENPEDRELALLLDNTPSAVSSLRPSGKVILRGSNKQNSDSARAFALIAPIGETVLETEPEFRWEKMTNAKSYKISIFDQDFNEILTTQVSGNSFKPEQPLKRGGKYLWRVVAQTNDGEILSPLPPHPPMMFRVAGEKAESRIESFEEKRKRPLQTRCFLCKGRNARFRSLHINRNFKGKPKPQSGTPSARKSRAVAERKSNIHSAVRTSDGNKTSPVKRVIKRWGTL